MAMTSSAPSSASAHSQWLVAAPPGWWVRQTTEVVDPGREVHVSAASELVAPGTDAYTHARRSQEASAALPGYQDVTMPSEGVLGGSPCLVRQWRWQPEVGREVMQLQAYIIGDGVAHTLTATWPAEDDDVLRPVVDQVLAGTRLVEAGPRPAS